MTREERAEFKEVVSEVIDPMVIEFRSANSERAKEIKTLFKQSAEHYSNFRSLEDKFNSQIHECQMQNSNSSEKQGDRIGKIEQRITGLETEVHNIKDSIADSGESSRWSKEMWIMLLVAVFGPIIAQVIMNYAG